MPFGASDAFLSVCKAEPRRAAGRLVAVAAVTLLGLFVAEMADAPRFGAYAWGFAISLLVGLAIGAVWGWRTTARWGRSLRAHWSRWNQAAIGAGSVAETAARVSGARDVRTTFWAVLAGVMVILNGGLFVAAWNTLPPTYPTSAFGAFAWVAVASTGLVCGVMFAHTVARGLWGHHVGRATVALVREGRLGVWGTR